MFCLIFLYSWITNTQPCAARWMSGCTCHSHTYKHTEHWSSGSEACSMYLWTYTYLIAVKRNSIVRWKEHQSTCISSLSVDMMTDIVLSFLNKWCSRWHWDCSLPSASAGPEEVSQVIRAVCLRLLSRSLSQIYSLIEQKFSSKIYMSHYVCKHPHRLPEFMTVPNAHM